MAKMYTVVSKDDPTKTVTCDWQNASELVFHGFWVWPTPNHGKQYFRAAQAEAMRMPPPSGFPEDSEVAMSDDDDDDFSEPEPYVPPTPEPVAPVVPTAALTLADLDKDELVERAFRHGIKVDKRWGHARLISAIEEVEG